MKVSDYEIFADEAWTQSSEPLRRYWCFLGGIFGSVEDLDRLDKILKNSKAKSGIQKEIKWTRLKASNVEGYKLFVSDFFEALYNLKTLRYRQMFLDRSFIHYESYLKDKKNLYPIDTQFKLYYQFIKHQFSLSTLPSKQGEKTKLFVRLDDHSSQKHKENLESFLNSLPGIINRPDLEIRISYVNSGKNDRIQICDLLMGAAGSHGNKMQSIRADNQRGMTPKQKIKDEFCKYVYNKIRKYSCEERGTMAFNWFESTGQGKKTISPQDQKINIWKFVPRNYLEDQGWKNDNLKNGNYLGPIINEKKVFRK